MVVELSDVPERIREPELEGDGLVAFFRRFVVVFVVFVLREGGCSHGEDRDDRRQENEEPVIMPLRGDHDRPPWLCREAL
ncbi:MAG: hypothetical protein M5R36_07825 [Deltaproteobacteria bacterium]|nr:hypothetical protein [Deltaproteobacteria bacterium]